MYLLIITVTAQFSLKCATWLLIKCLFMHSAKLICRVASLSTLQLNLWNMKLDQHGITFVNKICRKGIKVHTLSIKRGDSISIKARLCKYTEESMACAIWAMTCAKLFWNCTPLSLSVSGTLHNWIKKQEQIPACVRRGSSFNLVSFLLRFYLVNTDTMKLTKWSLNTCTISIRHTHTHIHTLRFPNTVLYVLFDQGR